MMILGDHAGDVDDDDCNAARLQTGTEVLIVGGVACNKRLQEMMGVMVEARGGTLCAMDHRCVRGKTVSSQGRECALPQYANAWSGWSAARCLGRSSGMLQQAMCFY
jgi:hypothetical protein